MRKLLARGGFAQYKDENCGGAFPPKYAGNSSSRQGIVNKIAI